jgi:hypothetical protein
MIQPLKTARTLALILAVFAAWTGMTANAAHAAGLGTCYLEVNPTPSTSLHFSFDNVEQFTCYIRIQDRYEELYPYPAVVHANWVVNH